mgnify:CR=1 FL=1
MKPKVGDAVETLTKFGLISSKDVQDVLTLLRHNDLTFRSRISARRARSWKAES